MTKSFDILIIGGGPGGYQAAIRAGQLGMNVACVDDNPIFGGACLRVGCIPSKALLESSERFEEARTRLALHGIEWNEPPRLNLPAMMAQKRKVVDGLAQGIEFLFKKNKVTGIKGRARLLAPDRVQVRTVDAAVELTAQRIVIATGSEIVNLPGIDIDEERIVSSTGALSLAQVPKRLGVIGAGVIGLELGSVWRRLGAEVTVLEYLDRITPEVDLEIAEQQKRLLEKDGWTFKLGMKATRARSIGGEVEVTFEPRGGGEARTMIVDVLLVAIGRYSVTGTFFGPLKAPTETLGA